MARISGVPVMKSPVLLITYRKHQFLDRIFHAIQQYAPPKLYVAHNHAASVAESDDVAQVRLKIEKWAPHFEIEYIFHPSHLGINESIHAALDYAFSKEERLIILEDDTLPTPSFFSYCDVMLEKHENDKSIGSIMGCNLGVCAKGDIYFFSPFALVYWGWATWASRWNQFDHSSISWKNGRTVIAAKLLDPNGLIAAWVKELDDGYGDVAPWDVQWAWYQAQLGLKAVLPGVNLVSNLGFVPEGTYTNFQGSQFSALDTDEINIGLLHPSQDITEARMYEQKASILLQEVSNNIASLENQSGR
jgi:hypothetical protein